MDIVPVLGLLGVALGCYTLYGAIYRLYLSLVASFPRAKLAVLTFWYEFYYDVVKEGQYTWKIAQFHDQSRPVVRINPFEIHINDPDFYDEVYVSPAKRMTKAWSWTVRSSRLVLVMRYSSLTIEIGTHIRDTRLDPSDH